MFIKIFQSDSVHRSDVHKAFLHLEDMMIKLTNIDAESVLAQEYTAFRIDALQEREKNGLAFKIIGKS